MIPGLKTIPSFINKTEETRLWDLLIKQPWYQVPLQPGLWVQQYGFAYDYKNQRIIPSPASIPTFLQPLLTQVEQVTGERFNQCIVNRYQVGQGRPVHKDSLSCGPTVISISLGAPAVLTLVQTESQLTTDLRLFPRTLLILQQAARYEWTHAIQPVRQERMSITFRQIKLEKQP